MALNTILSNAGRSLEVFTSGIQVAGQNIANAGTPGYIREKLILSPSAPYAQRQLVLGTGVDANGVRQQIDRFLETRIHTASSDYAASNAKNLIFKQLEGEIGELGDSDLSTQLNSFLAAIHEISNQPESAALRQLAVQEGQQLAAQIANHHQRIEDMRSAQSTAIRSLVGEANELVDTIDDLNQKITKIEAAGLLKNDAGGLRSQRYDALNRLSEIVPIQFRENPNGSADILIGSDYLLLSGTKQHLETVADVDAGVPVHQIRLTTSRTDVSTRGGELRGIVEGRDEVLGGYLEQLDRLASSLIYEFNRVYSSGTGLKGHESVTGTYQVDDINSTLNDAGLSFAPQHGSFDIRVTNVATGITETRNITVDLDGIGAETSLESLRTDIVANVVHVNASITADRRFVLSADSNYEISFTNDTSGVLASLGLNTFFTGSDGSDLGVNAAVVSDHSLFASGKGGGPADNRTALELSQFLFNPLSGLGGQSIDEFHHTLLTSVAQSSASEAALVNGFDGFRNALQNQRAQFSGVSLDEEAITLLEFQRAYQAAARIISTVDEMMQTLINI